MHPFLISIGSIHLPTYGAMLAIAVVAGIYIATRLGRRAGIDSSVILDYSSWVILVAIVGAKVLMILTLWGYYRDHPGEIFSYATLKLAGVFYGGFLAALFFTAWYVWVRKLPFWKFTDVIAPSVALGTAITRVGCFSAGCDYGTPTTVAWGVVFTNPIAHANTDVPLGVRLHPTQLYESLVCLTIFAVLLWWFPRRKHDGDIFLGYLGLYAVGRYMLEFLRGDEDRGFVFHHLLSTSQFIALLVIVGILMVFIWRRFHGGGALALVPATASGVGLMPSGNIGARGESTSVPHGVGSKPGRKVKRKKHSHRPD